MDSTRFREEKLGRRQRNSALLAFNIFLLGDNLKIKVILTFCRSNILRGGKEYLPFCFESYSAGGQEYLGS